MNRLGFLYVCFSMVLFSCGSKKVNQEKDLLSFVDPMIGTDYHGHTFPGATVPFGMVQLSPDTRNNGWDACGGYHYSDSSIIGFSHTHLSGTGIGDFGDILMMPFAGNPSMNKGVPENPDSGYRSRYNKQNQVASPGYYKVLLEDYDIVAELSATTRAGMHQYTFPEAAKAGIIIDLTHTIHEQNVPEGVIRVINEYEIEGLQKTKGWAQNHYTYFFAKFSKPFSYELIKEDVSVNETEISGANLKAKISFATEQNEKVWVKVGISGVDFAGAKKNVLNEIVDWDFENVVSKARVLWEKQINKISVEGGSEQSKRIFYTAMYHVNMSPYIYSDIDGRYRGLDQKIHKAKNPNYTVFSLWDTYRALHPLFTIIKPEYNQELIQALLRKHTEGGILPKWELASNYTGTMIGSHAVSVIVDAYMKGYRNFDEKLALEAIIQAMEYDSVRTILYPNENVAGKLMPLGKLYDVQYGYIPADLEKSSVAQGLEFAYNNWCVAEMAKQMGENEIAETFYKRSKNYRNYFDKETGFMRAKLSDGSWKKPFDPRRSEHNNSPYVEGNAWQWLWYVPQDVEGMIELFGSKDQFGDKLDSLFSTSSEITGDDISGDITGLIGQYAHGNEPSHHIAYLFNYADRPWKTQELVTQIIDDFYTDEPDGLCGNEDCGQMSAWYIFNAIGFYPVCPGSPVYSIGRPFFEKVEIDLGEGKKFVVRAENLSESNIYVQKVLMDNVELSEPFISHKDIVGGKELLFIMGEEKVIFWE